MPASARRAGAAALAVCGLLLTGCTAGDGGTATPAAAGPSTSAASPTAPAATGGAVDVPAVIRAVEPSVVTVFTEGGGWAAG